jgi:nitrogenase-associated protein
MEIIFYEKPGCINNTKQKQILEEKGHIIKAFSLLSEKWEIDTLRPFFGTMPVIDWFNKSAPQIKNGQINPADFNEETALKAMISDPILIKRPLFIIQGKFGCGFDNELIQELLVNENISDLLNCPNISKNMKCD